jgi:transcriptional regulator with XRE-family HTH domain
MTDNSAFKFYSDADTREAYWTERLKSKFAVAVEHLLDFRNLKKKDLAERLNVSRPYISKILRGDANLTIETIGRLAYALNSDVSINLTPKETHAKPWLYVVEGRKKSSTEAVERVIDSPQSSRDRSVWTKVAVESRRVANG